MCALQSIDLRINESQSINTEMGNVNCVWCLLVKRHLPPIPQTLLSKLLCVHVYVNICFLYVCVHRGQKRARVAGRCACYGLDTVPSRQNQPAPPQLPLWCFASFFFQNFNVDTQLKITHYYYPNLEPNITTAKQTNFGGSSGQEGKFIVLHKYLYL